MKKINTLLRERIGMSQEEKIEFDNLHTLLPQLAKELPFENLCIIENRTSELTEENLAHKFFTRNEGGVCYELNSLLYLFLVENNFDVKLVRGVIYENENNKWNDIGKTHVTILITYKEKIYLIDTGFGGNLPLKPVPFHYVTATEQSFTEWKDGKMTKREMNREEFEKLIQNYFGFKKV
ncbi:arylamine N-acetyltransferase [Priestia filamentosa]|nr:arylamine N-acetyltransferase [Priestia filamentosa]